MGIRSIRFRLLAIVFISLLPVLLLLLYEASERRGEDIAAIQAETLNSVKFISQRLEQEVLESRQMLAYISRLPEVLNFDSTACGNYLSQFKDEHLMYSSVFAVKPDGDIFCGAAPFQKKLNVSDTDWFRRIVETRSFSIGEYQAGRMAQGPIINEGLPVFDKTGQLKAVVAVAMDLNRLSEELTKIPNTEGMSIIAIDRSGTIIARYPQPEKWRGKNLPEVGIVKAVLTQEEGTVETRGVAGNKRIFSFTPVRGTDKGIYICLGISSDMAFAKVNRKLFRDSLLLMLTGLTASLIAWFGGDILIMRRMKELAAATDEMANGNLGIRVGIFNRNDEIDCLALSFNEMAAALEKHSAEQKIAEEKLKVSCKQLEDTIEFLPDATLIIDRNRNVLAWNRAIEEMTGISKWDIIGTHYSNSASVFYGEQRPFLIDLIFQKDDELVSKYKYIEQRGNTLYAEVFASKLYSGRGAYLWITVSPLLDVHGNLMGGIESIRDITERVKTEEEFKRISYQSELILRSSGEGILGLDLAGNHTFVNPSAAKMLGYTAEELIGGHSHLTWHHTKADGSAYPENECPIYKTFTDSKSHRSRSEIFWRKDGTGFPVSYMNAPIQEQGKTVGTVVTFRDITESKKADEAVRKSEEKYRSLFEESKDVVYISTPGGRFLDINPAGVELFGYSSKEELLNIDIGGDLYVNPEDRELFRRLVEEKGFVHDYEIEFKKKTGEVLSVLTTTSVVRNEKGEINAYRGIIRDITAHKKLKNQLLQAQKMEVVGQLAGGIAHDFNNIVSAMMGFASLCQMEMKEDDPAYRYISNILTLSERAANLTKSLLTFGRKQKIDLKPINLNDSIKKALEFLTRIIGRDVELNTNIKDENLVVIADKGQLEQVLLNFTANARDAMPQGGTMTINTGPVEIDREFIETHGYGKEGRYALITVSDTGIGMDEKTREKIFEPFFTTKAAGKGSGLGLAMVYAIIKQHNGFLNVYSEPGRGSTFRIYLPAVQFRVEEEEDAEDEIIIGGSETILLAEDDEALMKVVKITLEGVGYTVVEAMDGVEAVARFMENKDKIELFISDVIMPNKNGIEAFREILAMRPDSKALFMSGYAPDMLKKGFPEAEFTFITKPVSPVALLKKVREALDSR